MDLLGKIPIPVLIINGIHDEFATPEMAVKVSKAIRGSKLVLWEQMEHSTPDECPDVIAREFDNFMKNVNNDFVDFGLAKFTPKGGFRE